MMEIFENYMKFDGLLSNETTKEGGHRWQLTLARVTELKHRSIVFLEALHLSVMLLESLAQGKEYFSISDVPRFWHAFVLLLEEGECLEGDAGHHTMISHHWVKHRQVQLQGQAL